MMGFMSSNIGREKLLRFCAKLSSIGVVVLLFLSLGSLGVFGYYSYKVPSPERLTNRKVEQSTKIFDRNGVLLYDVFEDKDRTVVNLDDVSPYVIYATLATEDADFYKHQGFDALSIVRGGYNSLVGRGLQSGSTLTQQLTKNAILTNERSLDRKIKEFILSVQIENKYDKDDILSWYLNETPYGSTAYGIEGASQLYFAKSSSELNLAEAAYLAGLPQRPTAYSPFGPTPELGKDRQKYVLKLLHERGWLEKDGERRKISNGEYEEALKYEIKFASPTRDIRAPHFVFYVLDQLYQKYDENFVKSAGLKVTTTLDIEKQDEIQKIVQEELDKVSYLDVGNSAVVVIDPETRQILSMVGSQDYFDSENGGQFNVATSPTRQPGSSIKPLVYATALKQGYTASTVIMDIPTTFPAVDSGSEDYKPKNYDGKFRGPVQVRYTLANSINIPAVKMLKVIGVNSLLDTAEDFGITSFDRDSNYYGLSLALGGGEASLLEMTNAFAVFATGGYYQMATSIISVENSKGENLNYSIEGSKKKVLDEGIAYIISDILSDNQARLWAFGPGNQLEFRTDEVAAKTGTTDDIRDNWTLGYTKKIVVGVWAGNNDNHAMDYKLASGVTGAAPIWHRSIALFVDPENPNKFENTDNVVKANVGTITGGKPVDGLEESREEYFIKGTEPEVRSEMVLELEICEKDDKIANEKCIDDDKSEKREFIKLMDLFPEWQEATDDWVKENYPEDKDEFKKFYPPDEESEYDGDDDDD